MQVFKIFFAFLLGAFLLASGAWANSDITNRDARALRGVKAVVLLEPELDEASAATGVTAGLIERRVQTYLKGIGVQVINGSTLESGDRGETPSLLIQFGVSRDDRNRSHAFITLNVLRATAGEGHASPLEHRPIYIVQQRGMTRHNVTRNFLMRELDLALNMLREDLRRVNIGM